MKKKPYYKGPYDVGMPTLSTIRKIAKRRRVSMQEALNMYRRGVKRWYAAKEAMKNPKHKKPKILCPRCREEIWDVASGHKLNKCWNCKLAFDTESAIVKNPTSCEYCHLLHALSTRPQSKRSRKRALLRLRKHVQALHGNPPPTYKIRAMKLAGKLAYKIYRHVKDTGMVIPIPKGTPALVREYVQIILDANGIKWAAS